MQEKDYLQIPKAIFMVRPLCFGYNEETAASNAFQHKAKKEELEKIRKAATYEFDVLVEKLKAKNVEVFVFNQASEATPDAVFPNNWISFHNNGTIVMYPMLAENRRLERRNDILDFFQQKYKVKEIIDLSPNETQNVILEGTGSIIFDHMHHVAYANASPRTNTELFRAFCKQQGYEPVLFTARDRKGIDIYHTNVLMALGDHFAVICLESVAEEDRETVVEKLEQTGHEVVPITYDQMDQFAGNMIQVASKSGKKLLIMSLRAFKSLSEEQKITLGKYNELVYSDLEVIEDYGGGSARCMIAGIHLPGRN